jgi:hypothetical protein
MPRILLHLALAVAVVCAAVYGTARFLTSTPGYHEQGSLPPLTVDEAALAPRLEGHVRKLAASERNVAHPQALEAAVAVIEQGLALNGYAVKRHDFAAAGQTLHNIEAVIEPVGPARGTIVLGAHYDSPPGSPGAEENASGVAALLELARNFHARPLASPYRIRLVFFANGAAPYHGTTDMGSWHYAQALAASKERVKVMFALDSLGYYSSAPKSQRYPALLNLVLPSRADFVSIVGLFDANSLARHAAKLFSYSTKFPVVSGTGPRFVPSLDVSDNWAFSKAGYKALLFTDSGVLRYPDFGKPTDTPDKLDYASLARVTQGFDAMLRLFLQE